MVFDEATHTYIVDGKKHPSVTDVLSSIGTWREVGGWESLAGKTHFMNEDSRLFGTALHKTIELYNRDELEEYDPQLEPWLAGYKKFLKKKLNAGWQKKDTEKRVYSKKYGYAGTVDLIMTDSKERLWWIDYKSGLYMMSHNMQTAAYEVAYREMEGMRRGPTKNRMVLQLKPYEYKAHLPTHPNDFNLFLSALNIYKHLNK